MTPLHRSPRGCTSRTHASSSAAGRTWQAGRTRTSSGAARDCQLAAVAVEPGRDAGALAGAARSHAAS